MLGLDMPPPFWRRSSLGTATLNVTVMADEERESEKWVLVPLHAILYSNILVSWGSGIRHWDGRVVTACCLVHVNSRLTLEVTRLTCVQPLNAAPCFSHKVSISPLMHLPEKATEPGPRTLLTSDIFISPWNRVLLLNKICVHWLHISLLVWPHHYSLW